MIFIAQSTPQITAEDQFIIGAIIVVGIGIFTFLTQYLNLVEFVALVTGYAATGTAYGIYLLENNTSGMSSWWKYLVIIIVTVVAYALSTVSQDLGLISGVSTTINPAIIAAFVVVVANFAMNDLQSYKQYLPTDVVNAITIIIGAVVVVAEAVKNATPGTIVNVSTLLAVIVPVILTYVFQIIPWPPTPSPTPTSVQATGAH